MHLTVFLAVTLISGRIIASQDGVHFLDGFFFSVSAITAGGLVTLDMSRLSSGSHGLLFTLFTFAGVTFTALPPLLWRVWLFRFRFRPLIAAAQAAAARAEEAALAQRLAKALAASEAAVAHRTAAAAAKAQAAWSAPSAAAAAAKAHTDDVLDPELTLSPGNLSIVLPTSPSPSPPQTPPLPRGASFEIEAMGASVPQPMHKTTSFASIFGGGLFGNQDKTAPRLAAAVAEASAAEASRAAAAAAAFSEEDAHDYAALSADFEAQNEGLISVAVAVAFFVLSWQIFGTIAFFGCYAAEGPHLQVLVDRGISRTWLSLFLTSSALNNTGLSLLDDSLISIALRPKSLMVLAAAIIAGNTGWPVALRLLLQAWSALGSALGGEASGGWRRCRGVRYALAHPERCYHLLYDTRGTVAIAAAVASTTIFQLVFFYATSMDKVTGDLNELAAAQGVPPPSRNAVRTIMFFQIVSVRSAGFQVIDLKRVADVVNVIMAFMFWFAPQPFVAALREADESARLGIGEQPAALAEEEAPEPPALVVAPPLSLASPRGSVRYSVASTPAALSARTLRFRPNARSSAATPLPPPPPPAPLARRMPSAPLFAPDDVAAQLQGRSAIAAASEAAEATEAEVRGRHTLRGVIMRRYIARHASWLFLGYVTVAISEHALLEAPPLEPFGRSPTSLFNYLFELLSAYGTNGLSTGYPGVNFNLVGMWGRIGKLVVIGILFLGRHRNMPRAVDRPLAAHVRALGDIVAELRQAERAQRRALEAARAEVAAAEAAAAAAEMPRDEPHPQLRHTNSASADGGHLSLEEALAMVRAHVEKAAETSAEIDADGSPAEVAVDMSGGDSDGEVQSPRAQDTEA